MAQHCTAAQNASAGTFPGTESPQWGLSSGLETLSPPITAEKKERHEERVLNA